MAKPNNKTLMDLWEESKTNAITIICEAISTPAKYVDFRTKFKEEDIKKAIVQICNNLKKGKTPEDWDVNVINQANKITRYYADLIKSQKEKTSLLNKHRMNNIQEKTITNNNPTIGSSKDTQPSNDNAVEEIHNNENTTYNDQTISQHLSNHNEKKRKNNNEDEIIDIEIDESKLNEIIDIDNINPTKRQRIISKNYLRDENELQPGWHRINNIETRPVVLAKPDGKHFKDSTSLKQVISDALEEEEKDYGEIEQITKSQKVVVIHFDDIINRDKFMKYVKNNQPQWNCEIPTLKNPCIRINGVSIKKEANSEIDWNKWLERLLNKNKWIPKTQDSVFKINFKVEKNNKWNIVFEVSPNIRQAIVKKQGKIYSGLQKYDVYDTFNIHTCYNCSSYGHTTNQCGQQPVCRYCSKQHYTKCNIKEAKNFRCHACKNLGHAFNHPECPQFLWRLKHELQFINMNYEIIMTPPNQ